VAPAGQGDVTVVVPVWDAYVVDYLTETVDSLREQTPPPRVLIVDNASRVPVPRLPATEVIETPTRLSAGGARNFGLAHVTTPFTVFWDADDIMPPGTLDALHDRISRGSDVSLVTTWILDGSSGRRHHWPRALSVGLAARRTAFAVLQCVHSQIPSIGAMMRTDVAREAGGFGDLQSGEDWVLGAALAFRGRVEVIDRVGRIYRRHGDSILNVHQTPRTLLASARTVRMRMSGDPAVPRWTKSIMPVIAAAQWSVIRILRPLARRLRRH
jgi:glycosyltransferase involved in cell wall biosynthesis